MTTSLRLCRACGNSNPAQATFCMTCGESIVGNTISPKNLTGLLTQDQMIRHRYRILEQIGRGGFAAVYKAEDTFLGNRLVAVKEMSQSGLNEKERDEAVAAFQREAQMLAGLQHPHLPRIYDSFNEDGRWYLVMDFIEGETLEDFLQHRPDQHLSLKETLDIGLQLCSVLNYLHTRRPPIIFRDLKPANIMDVPPKHLYLIDFGIARIFKPGQSKDTIAFGSPGYAAPEQYGKAQTTQRSDIYSMGVLLHQLLSGEDPSENPFLFSSLHLNGSQEERAMESLIARMTDLKPENRPASVAEVQTELQAIANSTLGSRVGLQAQNLSLTRDYRENAIERPPYQEYVETGSGQVQELMPPENPSRRGFVIGSLIAGGAIALGVGSLIFWPKDQVVKTLPAPVKTAPKNVVGMLGADVMFGVNAQHTGFNTTETLLNTANVSRLKLAWQSNPIGNIGSSPIVSGDMLFLSSDGGSLYALDAKTGQTRWASEPHITRETSNYQTPAVVKGVVYSCLEDKRLYAFDAATGKLRWVSSENDMYASPTVVNDNVYVTGESAVYAIDTENGHVRWTAALGPTHGSPAVANGVVYTCMTGTGASMGRIHACDATTGKTLWLSDLINGGVDDNSSPTVANGIVYIGSGQGGLAAFDAATGHTRWVTAPTRGSTGSSPVVANGLVYNAEGRVYAFDATTGTLRWTSEDIEAANADSPMIANGVIYTCSLNHSVYALDATSGHILWTSAPTAGQIFTTPSISNGTLYVASADSDGSPNGIVYAYRLSDKT